MVPDGGQTRDDFPTIPPRMGKTNYSIARFLGRWLYALSIKGEIIRPAAAERAGGYVLACTHLSHLEPFIISSIVKRKIDWMARIEFFRRRIFRTFLYAVDAFPVNRFGVPVRSIRTAIARGREGRVVGIFPEGGLMTGRDAACRGGLFKHGACVVSMRAGIPIVPCVVLGTHTLTEVEPWLPFRRAKLWIAFGDPIVPVTDAPTRRAGREMMAAELSRAFCSLYEELLHRYDIADSSIP
jgi:1-acyl-sn-glycerol-3-phosphate acyltransferase